MINSVNAALIYFILKTLIMNKYPKFGLANNSNKHLVDKFFNF